MSFGPRPIEQARREHLWKQAIEDANAAGKFLHESQISGARDMLGYFEKLAIFDGSAAALVITFIGSTQRRLAPAWGIKVGLVLLLLGLIGAMFRNWCYFRYVVAVRQADYFSAQAKEQSARADYYEIAPRPISLQDGKPLNKSEFKSGIADSNEAIGTKVASLKQMERRNWLINVWSGNLAQLLTVAALALLAYVAVVSL
jgi:hypothetical protein